VCPRPHVPRRQRLRRSRRIERFRNRLRKGYPKFFPPGIDGSGRGPFFDLYVKDTSNPCTQGSQPANPNQNGIVFFPGALPLY
jgi:hypothetical protein